MKTPDKCYITREKNGVIYSLSFNDNTGTGTEYIRKDALIEWAKESMDSFGRLSYGEFIDKLNSM